MMCSKVIYTGLIKTEIGNWNSDGYFHRDRGKTFSLRGPAQILAALGYLAPVSLFPCEGHQGCSQLPIDTFI